MSVTMDEMSAKIDASEARSETKLERAMRRADIRTEKLVREMEELRAGMMQEMLRQRVWFLITAIFVVASTVSILSYLDYGRNPQAPIIINVPTGQLEQTQSQR